MRLVFLLVLLVFGGALLAGPVMSHDHDPPRILIADVKTLLDNGEDVIFLDSRTDIARAEGTATIPNAILINNNTVLKQFVEKTPKERVLVTFCT